MEIDWNKKVKVDIGDWAKFLLFIIALASISTCANTELIKMELNDMKVEQIINE